jgi:hypothetical protein
VLIDESAASGVSSDRVSGPVGDDVASVGRALVEAAVGPAGVVVVDVVAQELFELVAVPDEGAVQEFAARCRPTVPHRRSRPVCAVAFG